MGSDLWYVFEILYNQFTLASAVGFDAGAGKTTDVDSRAMRKIEDGQDLITVAETGGSSAGAIISAAQRTLIKLH